MTKDSEEHERGRAVALALVESLSSSDEDDRAFRIADLTVAEAKYTILGVILALDDTSEEVRRLALRTLQHEFCLDTMNQELIRRLEAARDARSALQLVQKTARLARLVEDARAARMPGWHRVDDLIKRGQEDPMPVDRFEAEYPEELPDRLGWLESRMQINRSRLLQLFGLAKNDVMSDKELDWHEITARVAPQLAERVEHLLTHYLSYFDYDAGEASQFSLRFSDRLKSGEINLEEYIPDYREQDSLAKREDALITAILDEGPGLLPAVATLLFSSSLPSKTASTSKLETAAH
jgi:hypothetical protein